MRKDIAPEKLDDYFWRVVETYQGPSGYTWSANEQAEVDADRQSRMAILLWLYGQQDQAKHLASSAFDFWENEIENAQEKSFDFRDRRSTYVAMALTDPSRAADFAFRCEESISEEMKRRIPQPWEIIGQSLTKDRWELGKMVSEFFHLWTIDKYDL
ncbi:MAG: hypothetical protein AAF497_08835 [Planctomycetota bacterium]